MKAVLYARVSSKEQEQEGYSIEAQKKLLLEYARNNGIVIAERFIDVETAKSTGRVEFGKMVEFLQGRSDVKTILVEKTDRLYRNFRDYVTLDDLDVEIHLVKENEVLSKNSRAHTKLVHGIKVVLAKNYIDNLSEEVKKGLHEKAEQGEWPNKAPLGYLNDKETHLIDTDPERAPIIEEMFRLYATGEYSLTAIAKRARERGLRYRSSAAYCSRSNVQRILKNPIYAGTFIWNGKRYQGRHVPIVSQELFDKVQQQFEKLGKPKYKSKEFAFKGLLKCGYCGCSITAEIKKGRYIYYRCTNGRGKCNQPYIREEKLAELFAEVIERVGIDSDTAEQVREALRASYKDEKRFRAAETAKLRREYQRLQRLIEKCYEDRIEGRISSEFWERLSEQWQTQQNQVAERMHRLENAVRDYYQEGVDFLELAQEAKSLYRERSVREKARLLRMILANCEIRDLTLCPTYSEPFNLLVDMPVAEIKLGDRDSNPE